MPALRLLATPCMLIATPLPQPHTHHTRAHTHTTPRPQDMGTMIMGKSESGLVAVGDVLQVRYPAASMLVHGCV